MATSSSAKSRVCFATLLTTDSYLHGALTLAASLRATGTSHEIVCLVADSQLSRPALERLETAFDRIINVPILQTDDATNLALLGRPDLGSTVTKIGIWALVEYDRIAFLDADTLVLDSIDSLLAIYEPESKPVDSDVAIGHDIRPNGGMQNQGLLAAAPDLGWPDCFNSGVFVAAPSKSTHSQLLHLLATQGSFDGGDQGLLNAYFGDWSRADHTRRLPFAYNTTSTSFYSYAPAFAHFAHAIKVVHFIGARKPWKWSRTSDGTVLQESASMPYLGNVSPFSVFIEMWWRIHDAHVSLWSPEKGPYIPAIALSLGRQFDSHGGHAGSFSSRASKHETAITATSHSLDNAWLRNGGDSVGSDTNRANYGDNNPTGEAWGTFTPAQDFALSPTASSTSSSHSSKVNVRTSSD
ncbi:glycogenin glucosyltransferase [Coemansia sp. RSA 562]|nr:glycogenin glucosyltransferase [Coemansia sp. RSA 564]KAJ2163755.1 glycogenin glucosyltransferase [Coemansia sp. RSA 562]KAJ2273538.1 glycogenin glucosyltransferase [Coemansia sp. RSA 370]KAJ2409379.1 glycogenin glucosyltransferase [Coemansia sp. RSA 2526]